MRAIYIHTHTNNDPPHVIEAEKIGLEREAFLHSKQEQEKMRRDELQQCYADRERQQTAMMRERKDRRIEEQKSERQEQDKGPMLAGVHSVRGPYLPSPQLIDGRDNIDSVMRRFEDWATQGEFPCKHWSDHLGNTLSRAALDIFTHLPPSSQLDYGELKKAILVR